MGLPAPNVLGSDSKTTSRIQRMCYFDFYCVVDQPVCVIDGSDGSDARRRGAVLAVSVDVLQVDLDLHGSRDVTFKQHRQFS